MLCLRTGLPCTHAMRAGLSSGHTRHIANHLWMASSYYYYGPTRVCALCNISISSAVFAQHTVVPNIQSHRHMLHVIPVAISHILLTHSDSWPSGFLMLACIVLYSVGKSPVCWFMLILIISLCAYWYQQSNLFDVIWKCAIIIMLVHFCCTDLWFMLHLALLHCIDMPAVTADWMMCCFACIIYANVTHNLDCDIAGSRNDIRMDESSHLRLVDDSKLLTKTHPVIPSLESPESCQNMSAVCMPSSSEMTRPKTADAEVPRSNASSLETNNTSLEPLLAPRPDTSHREPYCNTKGDVWTDIIASVPVRSETRGFYSEGSYIPGVGVWRLASRKI